MTARLFSAAAVVLVAGFMAAAEAKSQQIRSVQDPIYHFYLQAHPDNASLPVMGPESSSEYFDISGSLQSANTTMYLNINTGDSTSYKSLTFAEEAGFSGWALEGDTIITSTDSSLGRQLNFLACERDDDGEEYWDIYLQTGSDVPSGRECSNYQTLHLPCLC